MPFHHGLVRIGTLAALRIARTRDVIHVSHVQRASILAPLDSNGFVGLLAVLGQFECSAHPAALRTLFVRYKLAAIPMRGDFLIIGIRGFLQLASIGIENELVKMLVGDVHFRILTGDRERAGRANQFLYLFVVPGVPVAIVRSPVRVTAAGVAAAPGITSSTRIAATARITTAAWVASPTVTAPARAAASPRITTAAWVAAAVPAV